MMGLNNILTYLRQCRVTMLSARGSRLLKVLALINFAVICQSISAQVVVDSATIRFRQSQSNLDLNIGDNRKELERMSAFIAQQDSDSSSLKVIRVEGGASPEGSISINERLSHKRANTIFDYFRDRFSLPDLPTESIYLGRDWRGLYTLVSNDADVPYRQDVLAALKPVAENTQFTPEQSDRMLATIKRLHGGVPYKYMFRHLFPVLRESKLYVEFEKPAPAPAPIEPVDTVDVTLIDSIPEEVVTVTEIEVEEPACKPFYMGLKSNLLYDALAIPSIGVEFYLGKNWSIAGNWSYGWWDKDSTHKYWRAYGGDLSVRKWFGSAAKKKPLTGHHLGLYSGLFTYDFEFGGTGYMGGRPGHSLWDRCMFTSGIEYGYSLPIARRLNLDFTIGVGYVTGKVVKYHPKNNMYVWDSTKRINTVLPTKLEISLVWLIGCDNYNRR